MNRVFSKLSFSGLPKSYLFRSASQIINLPKNEINEKTLRNLNEKDLITAFDYALNKKDLREEWDDAMHLIAASEDVLPLHRPTEEELLGIRASKPTMTLASLVNESKILQNLVDLGVELHVWDKEGHQGLAVKLNLEDDVYPIVRLLADVGVQHDNIGKILTYCPRIFEEQESTLKTRIAYLVSKRFSMEEISHIITHAPSWLSFNVRSIDARLGFFQKTFDLIGDEVRNLTVAFPSLITWKGTPKHVKKVIFTYNEEMGFTKEEIKMMTLENPSVLKRHNEEYVLKQFDILHNDAKFAHELLAKFPNSLLGSWLDTKSRLDFLKHLGRDQFDPSRPNYVSPDMLATGDDSSFCISVAKCPLELYDEFLKTL